VQILPGVGDGTFLPSTTYTVGAVPYGLVATDLNQDNFPDLVTSNYGNSGEGHQLHIRLNTGTGGFHPAQSVEVSPGPGALASGDVNNDGFRDVVVLSYGSQRVEVLRGKGDGTFYPRTSFLTGDQPTGMALGDISGDGRLDILVSNGGEGFSAGYPSTLSVYLGTNLDVFTPAGDYFVSARGTLFLDDFNGDDRLDVGILSYFSRCVGLLMGNDDGTLRLRQDYLLGASLRSLAVGDVNGDTLPDLVLGENNGSTSTSTGHILLGNADGSFHAGTNVTLPEGEVYLAKGDFNRDGKVDIAAAGNQGNSLRILLGNGNGTFQSGNSYAVNSPRSIAVGDVNGDNLLDIVVGNPGHFVSLFLGNGNGTFQPPASALGGVGAFVILADINRDGRQDLIATQPLQDIVRVRLGAGDGTFPVSHDYPTASYPSAVTAGDWNGDGNPDLAVVERDARCVGVRLGVGDGTFLPETAYPVGGYPYVVASGDVNGDGILDLVTGSDSTGFSLFTGYNGYGGVSVLLGVGDGTFQARTEYTVGALPGAMALYDFNQDGWQDIVTANATTQGPMGSLSVLLNLGASQAVVSGNIQREELDPAAAPQLLTFTFRPEDGSSIFTRQILVNSAGAFHLTHLPRKRYTLHIKGAKWLATNVPVDVISSDVANLQALLKAGDANDDNAVDVFDLDILIQAFNTAPGDPDWNSDADFNVDGFVDVFDLDFLIRNFNEQGAE
jgi:hypothetical protein